MNVDVAVENDLCSVLQSLASDLDLMFVYDKIPANDRITYRVVSTGHVHRLIILPCHSRYIVTLYKTLK